MNNLYKLVIFLVFFNVGCVPNIIQEKDAAKEINSLDLNIFSKNGDKKYSINSPHSIYDNFKNEFQFQNTTINIFQDDTTKYILFPVQILVMTLLN